MSTTSFERQIKEYASLTEQALAGMLQVEPGPSSVVEEAMAYSALGGGKRVRAVMLLAFFHLYHEDLRIALPFAAALEMVHAYSLVHDDLPCMDDDDMRRGKPACHIAFGEATAVLAGDGLLTRAFEAAANAPGIDSGRVLGCIACLGRCAGSKGMIGGQVMDLANEGRLVDAETLRQTDDKKTGALFSAAAVMGCIAGGASEEELGAADRYARKIGLAFQIMDDILDCTADPDLLGKPVNSDKENKKTTYVSVYGMDACRNLVEQLSAEAKEELLVWRQDTAFLETLAETLARRQK